MKVIWLGCTLVALASAGEALAQTVPGAGPSAGSAQVAGADPLDVNGARLGMTLQAWQALPHGGDPHLTTACSAAPKSPAGAQTGPAPEPDGAVICNYVARYGQMVLQQSFPFTGAFLARSPRYIFVDGRLTQIAFQSSVNAFNALDALFTTRFGAPIQTLRDDVEMRRGFSAARVRREWRTAREDLWIVDPSTRPDQLAVRYGVAANPTPPPRG